MINGIMNIYKEAGYTSHDVVAKLRGIVKQRKIGHTGTLDPDAVGVHAAWRYDRHTGYERNAAKRAGSDGGRSAGSGCDYELCGRV